MSQIEKRPIGGGAPPAFIDFNNVLASGSAYPLNPDPIGVGILINEFGLVGRQIFITGPFVPQELRSLRSFQHYPVQVKWTENRWPLSGLSRGERLEAEDDMGLVLLPEELGNESAEIQATDFRNRSKVTRPFVRLRRSGAELSIDLRSDLTGIVAFRGLRTAVSTRGDNRHFTGQSIYDWDTENREGQSSNDERVEALEDELVRLQTIMEVAGLDIDSDLEVLGKFRDAYLPLDFGRNLSREQALTYLNSHRRTLAKIFHSDVVGNSMAETAKMANDALDYLIEHYQNSGN